MTIPVRGIYYHCLFDRLDKSWLSASHEVKRVFFNESPYFDQPKYNNGYFKRCDVNYPEKLAKYALAFSLHMRMALRGAAAEEMPVYEIKEVEVAAGDQKGQKIKVEEFVGTMSVEIPHFKPMFDNPDKYELIRCNIAEKLIAALFNQNDDVHCGNLGLTAIIDYDMCGYPITSQLKGERYVSGVTVPPSYKAFRLTAKDILNFPILTDVVPCYWPTNFPKNGNVRKDFSNRDQFLLLKDEPLFIRQKYIALLKQLLMFDEDLFRKKLSNYFLPDDPFVNECVPYFVKLHDDLYQLLASIPEFVNYIKQDPSIVTDVLQWFAQDDPAEMGIEPDKAQQKFLCFWRDCFLGDLSNKIKELQNVISEYADNETTLYSSLSFSQSAKSIDSGSGNSDLGLSILHLKNVVDTQNKNNGPRDYYIEICKQLSNKILEFYNKNNFTAEEYLHFLYDLGCLATESANAKKLDDDVFLPAWSTGIVDLLKTITEMRLPKEIASTNIMQMSILRATQSTNLKELVAVTHPTQVNPKDVGKFLFDWINKQDTKQFREILKYALKEYNGYWPLGLRKYTFVGRGGQKVEKILADNASPDCSNLELFCKITHPDDPKEEGGWDINSYNTLMLHECCECMALGFSLQAQQLLKFPGTKDEFRSAFVSFTPAQFKEMCEPIWGICGVKPYPPKTPPPVISSSSSQASTSAAATTETGGVMNTLYSYMPKMFAH